MRSLLINQMRVRNFKNLGDCILKTDSIATIVGANNSGKSNFLEVFTFLRNLLLHGAVGADRIKYLLGGFQVLNEKKEPSFLEIDYNYSYDGKLFFNCLYKIEFLINEDQFEILNETFDCKEQSKKGPHRRLINRTMDSIELRDESKARSILKTQSALEFIRNTFPDSIDLPSEDYLNFLGVIQIASTHIFNVHSIENYNNLLKKRYSKLFDLQESKSEKFEMFKEWFCRILDLGAFKINQFKLPDMKDESFYFCLITIENTKNRVFRLEDSSDGTKVMFLMLYDILIENKNIIVIDEPEIGLHPKAIASFLDLFVNHVVDKQLIFTTHSTFILNYLSPEFIHVIERTKDGSSKMIRACDIEKLDDRLKSKHVNFGDMFASGFKTHVDTSL